MSSPPLENQKDSGQRVQRVFTILGISSFIYLFDGLWGFGHDLKLFIVVVLCGLSVLVGAVLLNRFSFTAIIGLLLCSIVLGSILAECLIRFCLMEPTPPENDKGFQKLIASTWPREVEPIKNDKVFRILGVCDSFGVVGIEKNYHWILEKSLNEKGIPVEVVNFSACGYEPIEELTLVRRFASRYHPNLVLHGLYLGNDLRYVKVNADRVLITKKPFLRFSGRYLLRPWYHLVFRWARWQMKALPGIVVRFKERLAGVPVSNPLEEEFYQTEIRNLQACQKGAPERMNWDAVLELIHQIQDEAGNMGADYSMVLHPDQCQVDSVMFDYIMKRYGMDPADYDLDQPQRFLKEDCERRGIPCHDLTPMLRKEGMGGGLYYPLDIHLNETGNRLTAEGIEEFLLSQGLVPVQAGTP